MNTLVFPTPDYAAVPQPRHDDLAIDGAAARLLTSRQRQRLAIAARRAYEAQEALGLSAEADFDDWRHARVRETTGRAGLRDLTQRAYGPMMARFIELAGGSPRRRDWRAAAKPAGRDDADRARRALRSECAAQAAAFGGPDGADAYAATLLSRIHKTDWMSASARQLWQVLFTIRNRAHAKRTKQARQGPPPSGAAHDTQKGRQGTSPAFPAP